LADADPANNTASWQWVAGCGADAAPYFRIFNPIIQGLKFDPEGAYTKTFIPEIKGLMGKHVFAPWEAKPEDLAAAGLDLGTDYPHPLVRHEIARDRALAIFKSLQ
jgi:deoxyribodipyrimidine photo-lyase